MMDEEVQVTKKRAPNKTIEARRELIDQKIQWHGMRPIKISPFPLILYICGRFDLL